MATYFWEGNTVFDRMEWRTVDWRFQVRGPIRPNPDIAIVSVDEESIREVGRWPWPRERYARLIDELSRLGAKAIVFDIFVTEPDNTPGGAAADKALGTATRRAGNVYHPGFVLPPGTSPWAASPQVRKHAWSEVAIVREAGFTQVAELIAPQSVTFPLPALAAAARGVGVANVLDSGDGIYRHLVPLIRYENTVYPSMSLAVAADLLGTSQSNMRITPGKYVDLGKGRRIPLDMHGRMLINFVGNPGHAYKYISAASILDGLETAETIKGKIVLVGVTAPGIYDLRASPYETNFHGVESEANAIDNALSGNFLWEVPPLFTALLLVGIVLTYGFLLPRLATPELCLLSIGAIATYPWLAIWLFSRHSMVVDLVHPMGAMLGSFMIVLMLRLLVEERRRDRAQTMLRYFVPPQLVGRLVEDEALTTMRGDRREISVFFADLRNFTATAEELAPEDTVLFLNRYFSLMHEVIFEHSGTLDKYIGDEIMVFFNAPVTQSDHARLAVMTAIDMQRRIMANQAEWDYLQVPSLHAGIGIATGPALVGYVGSAERMQYTVIGRTVNLASRLQTLCKQLKCRILISDATYQAVADLVEAEDLGEMPIAGFTHPVRVWHVLDYKADEMRGHWGPVDQPIHGRAEPSGDTEAL
ncbi:MAG: CHASE2 domain-containing protein [Armatimonadota bacterium]